MKDIDQKAIENTKLMEKVANLINKLYTNLKETLKKISEFKL